MLRITELLALHLKYFFCLVLYSFTRLGTAAVRTKAQISRDKDGSCAIKSATVEKSILEAKTLDLYDT